MAPKNQIAKNCVKMSHILGKFRKRIVAIYQTKAHHASNQFNSFHNQLDLIKRLLQVDWYKNLEQILNFSIWLNLRVYHLRHKSAHKYEKMWILCDKKCGIK